MNAFRLLRGCWLILCLTGCLTAGGYDTGVAPEELVTRLSPTVAPGQWLRLRQLENSSVRLAPTALDEHPLVASRTVVSVGTRRSALTALRGRGYLLCALVRWGPESWLAGVRAGRGHRLPLDLREVWERGRQLAVTYGDLVDAWEIDNEPDIGFGDDNAEAYSAYFKAIAAGLRTGQAQLIVANAPGLTMPARVIMAPMALPPGPFFQRLLDNDLLAYSDGINWHFYGHASEFTGVYDQFADAVKTHGETADPLGRVVTKREWPVFITEYGYAGLDSVDRDTVAGRVNQWRWFLEVQSQVERLRIAAPMAFLLTPYLESQTLEYGLSRSAESSPLSFKPSDFGYWFKRSWMKTIGIALGADLTVTPALAWLQEQSRHRPKAPVGLAGATPDPSPVVIDFIPGAGLRQFKSHGSYLVGNAGSLPDSGDNATRTAEAELVLYNFGPRGISGSLHLPPSLQTAERMTGRLVLSAGERLVLPVKIEVTANDFSVRPVELAFIPESNEVPASRWCSAWQVWTPNMVAVSGDGLDFKAVENADRRRQLLNETRPPRVAPLHADGRWLVTDGLRIVESNGEWRFEIDHFPGTPLWPAMAMLPLPDGFSFNPGQTLIYDYRSLPALDGAMAVEREGADEDLRYRAQSSQTNHRMKFYIQTENGNWFSTWPRDVPTADWTRANQNADAFTGFFFGRSQLPWRFAENRPVALVFTLTPKELPAVFVIRDMRIVKLQLE